MPRADDILESLGSARYFSVIDLKSGFWQIMLHPADAAKTAFSTPKGKYEFIRMPFGLRNAPATFQRIMDQVLGPYLGQFARVYIDDIIIYSKSFDDHLHHVAAILDALRTADLRASPTKSKFGGTRVKYLGHEVSPEGIRPSPEKLQAIEALKPPEDADQLRSYLGLTGYYRKFVGDYSRKVAPMQRLLKGKVPFK